MSAVTRPAFVHHARLSSPAAKTPRNAAKLIQLAVFAAKSLLFAALAWLLLAAPAFLPN